MITKLDDWQRPILETAKNLEAKVGDMLSSIELNGDDDINRFARDLDHCEGKQIELKPFDEYPLESPLKDAILLATKRIQIFAEFQKENGAKSSYFEDQYGRYSQTVMPLERVGAYIPGGRFPLISTALMTLIPAKVAGCPVRIASSPSDNIAIQAAASLAGATKFIQLGGVQAIGAFAFGFDGELPMDIIVGPGNAWVNEAKKQIRNRVKIDGLAGPSELLAICDGDQPIEWLAYDALAQAEHDPLACSIVISDSESWLAKMAEYLNENPETRQLVNNRQVELLLANSKQKMIEFSNIYAPEHLMLCHQSILPAELFHYGSLFIGANSGVALGDYISGPNHTLPTLGFSRQDGGLSVNTFQKIVTGQAINQYGRKILSEKAQPLANAEGLTFHVKSLAARG
jgi:histidinol dehydrogenase